MYLTKKIEYDIIDLSNEREVTIMENVENMYLDKLKDWFGVKEFGDSFSVSKFHSADIGVDYHERYFLVTEDDSDSKDFIHIYIIRMFGFDDNISLSVDYDKRMKSDEVLENLVDIIKIATKAF